MHDKSDLYRENLKLPYEYMSLIQDLSPYDDHFFKENQTYLEYLRRFEDGYGISKDEFYEMPKIHPELYEELVRMASEYTKTDKVVDVALESLIRLKNITPEGGSIAFVHLALAILQKNCEDLVYIHQRLDKIRSAVTNIKEKRYWKYSKIRASCVPTRTYSGAFTRHSMNYGVTRPGATGRLNWGRAHETFHKTD
jgi:hypothetical protein